MSLFPMHPELEKNLKDLKQEKAENPSEETVTSMTHQEPTEDQENQ